MPHARSPSSSRRPPSTSTSPPPEIETSRLKRKLADADEFVVTAEVEPPKGADCATAIEGARLMKAGGVDAVNVTDNPMARLRMSSIAVAALIQRETGLEAVVQITTRDRNVLGLQSDLLGAAGLGLKAILCLGRRSAEDRRLPAGQAGLGGGRARPAADGQGPQFRRRPRGQRDRRSDALRHRLRRQPRAPRTRRSSSRRSAPRSRRARPSRRRSRSTISKPSPDSWSGPEAKAIPILIGLIPLLSLKQTLFFANEVPGVVVPPAIQDRMRRAAERGAEHEKAEGLAIARELAAGIARLARGIHVMPMGKYKTAGEILQAIPRAGRPRSPDNGIAA